MDVIKCHSKPSLKTPSIELLGSFTWTQCDLVLIHMHIGDFWVTHEVSHNNYSNKYNSEYVPKSQIYSGFPWRYEANCTTF